MPTWNWAPIWTFPSRWNRTLILTHGFFLGCPDFLTQLSAQIMELARPINQTQESILRTSPTFDLGYSTAENFILSSSFRLGILPYKTSGNLVTVFGGLLGVLCLFQWLTWFFFKHGFCKYVNIRKPSCLALKQSTSASHLSYWPASALAPCRQAVDVDDGCFHQHHESAFLDFCIFWPTHLQCQERYKAWINLKGSVHPPVFHRHWNALRKALRKTGLHRGWTPRLFKLARKPAGSKPIWTIYPFRKFQAKEMAK